MCFLMTVFLFSEIKLLTWMFTNKINSLIQILLKNVLCADKKSYRICVGKKIKHFSLKMITE